MVLKIPEIRDNFLPTEMFEVLLRAIIKDNNADVAGELPLYYMGSSIDLQTSVKYEQLDEQFKLSKPPTHCPHFSHVFFYQRLVRSPMYEPLILPIIKLIDPVAVQRIKLNINTHMPIGTHSGWHVDSMDPEVTTGILYLTTNDSGTLLEDGTYIKAVANRFACFPSHLAHTGVVSTSIEEGHRIVINFNYVAREKDVRVQQNLHLEYMDKKLNEMVPKSRCKEQIDELK